ncbi:flagellar protein FlaG [Massilia aerilata]|uniref:Flagellar protein FlaG n=1 Tax=Massilia aerilata TaxID=453817 RepID=A0ABW0RTI3_9BURK
MELRPLSPPPAAQATPGASEPAPTAVKSGAAGPVDAPASTAAKPGKTDIGQLDKAVEHINKSFEQSNQGVEFSIDKETDITVVKVVDRETREVLRQMPSEEALAVARQIDRMQGLLIKQEA